MSEQPSLTSLKELTDVARLLKRAQWYDLSRLCLLQTTTRSKCCVFKELAVTR